MGRERAREGGGGGGELFNLEKGTRLPVPDSQTDDFVST